MSTSWRLAAAGLLAVTACKSEPPRDADGNIVTVGTYRVRTYPRGAEVWIDGELEVPKTPATLILEAGEYALRIQHPGAKEGIEESITVEAAKEKTLDVRIPAPERSTLSVVSDVEGASVRVNGYRRGVTPLDPVTVNAGAVDITVTAPDGRARAARTRLDYGEDEVLRVDFAGTSTSSEVGGETGRLTLVVAPSGWVENERGERVGDTPLRDLKLPPGRHLFRLHSADGRRARDVALRIGPGERAVYRFRLRSEDAVPDGGLPPLGEATVEAQTDAGSP